MGGVLCAKPMDLCDVLQLGGKNRSLFCPLVFYFSWLRSLYIFPKSDEQEMEAFCVLYRLKRKTEMSIVEEEPHNISRGRPCCFTCALTCFPVVWGARLGAAVKMPLEHLHF